MVLGNTEITRDMMPSFVDFNNNPKHLYGLMQDQLNTALNQPMPMMPTQPAPTGNDKQSGGNNQWQR